ncbi:MAG: gamma-glutamyltransferase [Saprospiraceae bacterium]|nr:gamma-glutamyltransferase [Saprospiraceae bacterium]
MHRFLLLLLFGLHILCATAQPIAPFPYDSTKVVVADSAAVVTAHPLATRVGLDILRMGGNAIDAAVAVHFALAVVYPQAGNLGGGGFLLYQPAKGEPAALDFRERAPAQATEKMYQDSLGRVLTQKSRFDVRAVGVPGAVDGMWEAHRKYGKLTWAELLEPAVGLAEKGYQITAREAAQLNQEQPNFVRFNRMLPAFVRMDRPWAAGDWLIQQELGGTLRWLISGGRDEFYRGRTAKLLVKNMQDRGGLITLEDLAAYKSVWRAPLAFDFQGMRVLSMPPPSSGGLLLQQMLGMINYLPQDEYTLHSAQSIHAMAEIERRAYADRAVHMGDPDFWKVPMAALTSPTYCQQRMADFDPGHATPSDSILAGVFPESEETTHFSIIDAQGNAVSVTTTLNDAYGSRTVVPGTGFILNNEMDDFSAKPGVPNLYGAVGGKANAIAPGKRPLSSMTPTIVLKNKKPVLIVGSPGGTTIPTSVFQVLVNAYVFNLSPEDCVQKGRFHHQWRPDELYVEEGAFPDDLLEQLRAKGHTVTPRSPIGRVEAIFIDEKGKKTAVADRRGDDCAGGY